MSNIMICDSEPYEMLGNLSCSTIENIIWNNNEFCWASYYVSW